MNLDELRSVQSAERESDALQHLRDGFYQDAGEYVEELREQRRTAAEDAADPYGDEEVRRLTDEIETAKAVTEAIWEARIGKILRVAGLSATNMSASAEGLTPEEAALFERVVEAIETNRETIQGALEGEEAAPTRSAGRSSGGSGKATDATGGERSRPTPPDDPDSGSVPTATPPDQPEPEETMERPSTAEDDPSRATGETSGAADEASGSIDDASSGTGDGTRGTADTTEGTDDGSEGNGDASEATSGSSEDGGGPTATANSDAVDESAGSNSDGGEDPSDESVPDGGDRVRVRITKDVGTIAGVDGREYHLATDDVAELPDANARPLVERDAAQILE